jgi:hypothetical protein
MAMMPTSCGQRWSDTVLEQGIMERCCYGTTVKQNTCNVDFMAQMSNTEHGTFDIVATIILDANTCFFLCINKFAQNAAAYTNMHTQIWHSCET